jgi:hypothetical protein
MTRPVLIIDLGNVIEHTVRDNHIIRHGSHRDKGEVN